MDRQITESLAVCDLVRGHKRSPKQLWLSFDEWNVWYRERRGDAVDGHKTSAPHLLEEIYNLEDALLVGGLLNTLIRNSNRVKIGCLAQLVNVIAPIMTNADGVFLQTIFYPYSWALQYARGAALDVMVESSSYDVKGLYGTRDEKTTNVPHLDVSGSYDASSGTAVAFILNRDLAKSHDVEIVWEDKAPTKVQAAWVLTGDDLKAVNSFQSPKKVVPAEFAKPSTSNGRTKFEVPAKSYTMVQWGM
jgi:alpha-L-arabinofuranosidase